MLHFLLMKRLLGPNWSFLGVRIGKLKIKTSTQIMMMDDNECTDDMNDS